MKKALTWNPMPTQEWVVCAALIYDRVITYKWDRPIPPEPLVGLVDTHIGEISSREFDDQIRFLPDLIEDVQSYTETSFSDVSPLTLTFENASGFVQELLSVPEKLQRATVKNRTEIDHYGFAGDYPKDAP